MDNLRASVPNAKVVVALRDPVDRAVSHWKWDMLLAGREAGSVGYLRDFDTNVRMALDLFPDYPMDSRCHQPLLLTGIYYKAIEMWVERFGRDNVLVVNANEYFQERGPVLERIVDFLGLPPAQIADGPRVNENPLEFDRPHPSTREALAAFYQPYNERLYDFLDRDFGWTKPEAARQ